MKKFPYRFDSPSLDKLRTGRRGCLMLDPRFREDDSKVFLAFRN